MFLFISIKNNFFYEKKILFFFLNWIITCCFWCNKHTHTKIYDVKVNETLMTSLYWVLPYLILLFWFNSICTNTYTKTTWLTQKKVNFILHISSIVVEKNEPAIWPNNVDDDRTKNLLIWSIETSSNRSSVFVFNNFKSSSTLVPRSSNPNYRIPVRISSESGKIR